MRKTIDSSFNLFVYGTLMDPWVFRAVLGRRLVFTPGDADGKDAFYAQDAVLDGYRKVSPDKTYLYAVPDAQSRIDGYMVGPLPPECMAALKKYEGRNYRRRTMMVYTKNSIEKAVVFLANLRQLSHSFGYAFHDPLKQEILLREKIDAAVREAQREQIKTEDETGAQAMEELHGATIRDLVRRHFDAGGISDYAIRQSLKDEPLRDYQRIVGDPAACSLAPNYLALVVRQVIFNQVEERIRRDFRFELDRINPGEEYYDRTLSCLAALRMLNWYGKLLESLVSDCIAAVKFEKSHLVDYVRWAIVATDALYSQPLARQQIEHIQTHLGGGYIPLGAELEFSNIGQKVILDPHGREFRDSVYDGFLYFPDYALDVLTWKLGGHVDDHHEKASNRPRRGFFELALGNLSIEANLSKPITPDPWVLNQFLHEALRFYQVSPHSAHISMQLRGRRSHPAQNRLMPLSAMKCLLALAGDVGPDENGVLRVLRVHRQEIYRSDPTPTMLFSSVSRRHSSDESAAASGGRFVQQYKFLRLRPEINYEPIVMALKGVQLNLHQGTFLLPSQYESNRRHRHAFHELLEWGSHPETISDRYIESFLTHVYDGLMSERRGRPGHSEAYIAWSLSQVRTSLRKFNALLATQKE